MLPDLGGLRIVVTAGGTAEPIDAVRVITNLSTGKMGLALAVASLRRGADVTLISSAPDPTVLGLRFVRMSTVASLRGAVLRECAHADIVVMAAAVSDFRPVAPRTDKIRKTGEPLRIEFEPVADFLHEVPDDVFRVGFSAECGDARSTTRSKFVSHGFHIICANPIDEAGSGFGSDTNRITIVDRGGDEVALPLLTKADAAHRVLDYALSAYRRWSEDNRAAGASPATVLS